MSMAFFSADNQHANGFTSDTEYCYPALPEDAEMEIDGLGLFVADYNLWDAVPEFERYSISDMEENHANEEIMHLPLPVEDTTHSTISNNNRFVHASPVKNDTPHAPKLKRKIHEGKSSDFVEASGNSCTENKAVKLERSKRSRINNNFTDQRKSAHNLGSSEEEWLLPPNKEGIKEYVHLRARRGEATLSHSLAERVRREKIKDRMERLQKLIPGCCQVTGTARILDEIINYVQSMQKQVEYLSAKLASVTPLSHLPLIGDFMSTEDTNKSTIAGRGCCEGSHKGSK